MMMRPGDILGRIFFYVVTEINHRNLSTEHTEDTELFWKLLRKKSLGEIFNKNMAWGQKLSITQPP